MGRLVTTIMLLLGAAVVAGCSVHTGRDTIDPAEIEDTITTRLQDHMPGLRVDSVACPKGVKPAEGATFQCTAELEGAQAPVTVTLSHVNTNTGAFSYNIKPAKAIIDIDKVVKELKSMLHDQAPNATVDCGTARVRVVEVGGAIECTISAGGKRDVVRVVTEDVNGTVHFENQG